MEIHRQPVVRSYRWKAPEYFWRLGPDLRSEPNLTPKSDIHSFGMTMLEVGSFYYSSRCITRLRSLIRITKMYTCCVPFDEIVKDEVVPFEILRGKRPECPSKENAPQLTRDVWWIMQTCWNKTPEGRPAASVLWPQLSSTDGEIRLAYSSPWPIIRASMRMRSLVQTVTGSYNRLK